MMLDVQQSHSISPKYMALLDEMSVHSVKHSQRTFYEHLVGVHDLLQSWGNQEHVCVAGLFHSIYGTQDFKNQLLGYNKRSRLKNELGEAAEELVFLFSVSDRRTFYANLSAIQQHQPCSVVNRVTTAYAAIARDTLINLLEMDVANWLEQAERPGRANRVDYDTVQAVAKQLRGIISAQASDALDNFFERQSREKR